MRIALIHYSYLPTIGGVEFVMAEHARLFADAGHEVTVLCGSGESPDPRISVAHFPPRPRPSHELRAALRGTLKTQQVVFLHNVATMPFEPELASVLWDLAAELANTRFVCWVHDLAETLSSGAMSGGSAVADSRYVYVAVSAYRQRQLKAVFGVESRVIPNGIEPFTHLALTEPVARMATEERLFERDILLLHPARLVRRKNIEFALETTAALKAQGHDVCYLLTAARDPHTPLADEYADSLRGLLDSLDLRREALFVWDRFAVTKPDLMSLYSIADALFFPSQQEGFGIPILEAALHRLSIFCVDREPMNSLLPAHVQAFHANASPSEVAIFIADSLSRSAPTQARKTMLRDYAWSSIYRTHLAPFLAELTHP